MLTIPFVRWCNVLHSLLLEFSSCDASTDGDLMSILNKLVCLEDILLKSDFSSEGACLKEKQATLSTSSTWLTTVLTVSSILIDSFLTMSTGIGRTSKTFSLAISESFSPLDVPPVLILTMSTGVRDGIVSIFFCFSMRSFGSIPMSTSSLFFSGSSRPNFLKKSF